MCQNCQSFFCETVHAVSLDKCKCDDWYMCEYCSHLFNLAVIRNMADMNAPAMILNPFPETVELFGPVLVKR